MAGKRICSVWLIMALLCTWAFWEPALAGQQEAGQDREEMAEGYVTGIALDANDEIIGYKFVSLGKMTDFIKKGDDPNTAWEKAKGQYGRVADAAKIIDPRVE